MWILYITDCNRTIRILLTFHNKINRSVIKPHLKQFVAFALQMQFLSILYFHSWKNQSPDFIYKVIKNGKGFERGASISINSGAQYVIRKILLIAFSRLILLVRIYASCTFFYEIKEHLKKHSCDLEFILKSRRLFIHLLKTAFS